MCVKLLPRDLNLNPRPRHPTNTYTSGVTTVPRVCSGVMLPSLNIYRFVIL